MELKKFNPDADPKDVTTMGWEPGITAEWLLKCLNEYQVNIKRFILSRLYYADLEKSTWALRYYGGATNFYREVLQEVILHCLEHLSDWPQNCTLKHIFWVIRYKMKRALYRSHPEVYSTDTVINGDHVGSLIDNFPGENPIEITEKDEREKALRSFMMEIDHSELKNSEYQVLKYRYFEDMDYETICRKLNIGMASAGSLHTNAIKKVRMHYVLNNKPVPCSV